MTVSAVATVPRLFPSETIAILASGPSLTAEDVDYCRGRCEVIAVKDAIRLAPDSAVVYGCDHRWWAWHHGFPDVVGLKYSVDPKSAPYGVQVLRNAGEAGLCLDPSGVRTGKNSCYQAINVAVHLGAAKIVLLGADMGHGPHGPKYFFGDRPLGQTIKSPYLAFLELFETLKEPLAALGVSVINCSRQTALETFPKMSIEDALA